MHLLLVTDAWYPQVNGVVRTLDSVAGLIQAAGHRVSLITPEGYRTVPMPTYPEIRLALVNPFALARRIDSLQADSIHIATEGPLGWAARRYCLRKGLAFTTSFHTRFPEMISERLRLPGIEPLAYRVLRHFHEPASAMLVPTRTVAGRLDREGFNNVRVWTRGVDAAQFRPLASTMFDGLPRPIMLNAGRVAVEKNLEGFLSLDLPGTKVVVGDGPQLAELKARYPDVVFTGYLRGDELAKALTAADVFVFPSKTDTFGLVILEAMSCGVPVAAYPVEGPIDVVTSALVGALDDDLAVAISKALSCAREDCRQFAANHSWQSVADMMLQNLVPVNGDASRMLVSGCPAAS